MTTAWRFSARPCPDVDVDVPVRGKAASEWDGCWICSAHRRGGRAHTIKTIGARVQNRSMQQREKGAYRNSLAPDTPSVKSSLVALSLYRPDRDQTRDGRLNTLESFACPLSLSPSRGVLSPFSRRSGTSGLHPASHVGTNQLVFPRWMVGGGHEANDHPCRIRLRVALGILLQHGTLVCLSSITFFRRTPIVPPSNKAKTSHTGQPNR